MRDLSKNTGRVWTIRSGRLKVVSRNGYLPNEAVVLSTALAAAPAICPALVCELGKDKN